MSLPELSPLVSVIVPVHNRSELLGRALRSVASQSFSSFEIVVVDDGSTDDISAVLKQVGHQRTRLVRHVRRRGTAAARNTGVQNSRSPYLAFLDSDDEWLPAKLHEQLKHLTEAPRCSKVSCTAYYLHKEGHVTEIVGTATSDVNSQLLWGCRLSPGSTLLVGRPEFDRIGPFLEALERLEDWDWLLRCATIHQISILPIPLARIHSAGGTAPPQQVFRALKIIRSRRHCYGLSLKTPITLLKFESSILLEKTAAKFHAGQFFMAVCYGCACLLGPVLS